MSLAITEHKPHRPRRSSSCVSLFFQMFSKKNLFSKKLLPPARAAKKAAKKFDATPKLLLIADENRGGFPRQDCEATPSSSQKERINETQPAGLVARLMGLESMPVVEREKPRMGLDLKVGYDESLECRRVDQSLRVECRPQKVQKKQGLEFGLPVGSPRRGGASRLVQVANRILEPRSRVKPAIMYNVGCFDSKERLDELVGFCESCNNSDLSYEFEENRKLQAKVGGGIERKDELRGEQDDVTVKCVVRKNNSRQNSLPSLLVRDKAVSGTRGCSRKVNESKGAKDFVALNKNVNARSRSPTKASSNHRLEPENMGRKRRPTSSNVAVERSVRNEMINRRVTSIVSSRSVNRSCVRREMQRKMDGGTFSGSKDSGIVSFTFNSPMRRDSIVSSPERMVENRRGQRELNCDSGKQRKALSDVKSGNLSSQKGTAIRGDVLSNLLEEKIRELTSLEHDELETRDGLPGRSTASILEELISALTKEAPDFRENADNSDVTVSHNQIIDISEECQEEAQSDVSAAYLAAESNQPSPISVLEASFSNDTCSFGGFNGNLGGKLHVQLDICNKTQPSVLDSELLDSATSLSFGKPGNEKDLCSPGKTKSPGTCKVETSEKKLSVANEVVSDVELLFDNISLYSTDGKPETSFDSFLFDTLEAIIDGFYISPWCNLTSKQLEGNQLREFLFDCMMECLDSKYSQFCRCGFRTWLKLPLFLSKDRMRSEVHEEIRQWADLAGQVIDDLIEREVNGSTASWTECETETFKTGVDIESDILHALVDEMVMELC